MDNLIFLILAYLEGVDQDDLYLYSIRFNLGKEYFMFQILKNNCSDILEDIINDYILTFRQELGEYREEIEIRFKDILK